MINQPFSPIKFGMYIFNAGTTHLQSINVMIVIDIHIKLWDTVERNPILNSFDNGAKNTPWIHMTDREFLPSHCINLLIGVKYRTFSPLFHKASNPIVIIAAVAVKRMGFPNSPIDIST